MDSIQRLSISALSAVTGIGARTSRDIISLLIKHEVGWDEFWVFNAHIQSLLNLNERQIHALKKFKKEYTIYTYQEHLDQKGIRVIHTTDSEYPPLLLRCNNSPLVLFQIGVQHSWDTSLVVAVVGTRQVTAYGRLVTNKIVSELVTFDAVIVSGYMHGVDICAHRSCLESNGRTVGVLGFGFDHWYPASLQHSFEEMKSKMTFISPFAPHVAPQRGNFPARNRIVAGMSEVIVVTEAASKSGSHITAGYAADEGRVVCAVPGPITNPYSEGTTSLLNQGAVLVSSGCDIVRECGVSATICTGTKNTPNYKSPILDKIMSLLRQTPMSMEEIASELKLHHTSVLSDLTQLELSGHIIKDGWRWYVTA